MYNIKEKVILMGYKDPSMDLWDLPITPEAIRLQRSNPICSKFCRTRRTSGLPHIGGGTRCGGTALPFAQQTMPCNSAPMYLNIIKKYSNWNVCFSCGFDIKDGHTSKTCPAPWRRANHQESFNRNNTGQYIGAGHDACTKAMHKSQLPNM